MTVMTTEEAAQAQLEEQARRAQEAARAAQQAAEQAKYQADCLIATRR